MPTPKKRWKREEFPVPRRPMKRMPHTTPDKCLGHDRFLNERLLRMDRADIYIYLCRYCGDRLDIAMN